MSDGSGVASVGAGVALNAYPNPAVATLYVTCGFGGKVKYELFSENGATVYVSEKEAAAGTAQAIDVASLARGIYILKVSHDGKVATCPVIRK